MSMAATVRWGILGTGWIADRMAEALALLPDAELIAVGSRTRQTADAFAQKHGVPRGFATYEELVACEEVDVVYVASPHAMHARDASMALRAGKPVLCEKAFTVNAREAAEIIALARAERLFLMEAMWTRFVPAVVALREWIATGAIGEIRLVSGSLAGHRPYDPEHRLYKRELAGGALLDVGIYPLSFFFMLLGEPLQTVGHMVPAPNGVDVQCVVSLAWPSGALGNFVASFEAGLPNEVHIAGTEGWIRVHAEITNPPALTRRTLDGTEETVDFPMIGNGYTHEAIEVMRCLREGKLESDIMPLDESLSIMKTLDSIREPWGLGYPADGVET
jgi:predicted dehydrogenase